MTAPSDVYKYTQRVDYLADLIGADKAKDLLKVGIDPQYTGALDVTEEIVPTTSTDNSHEATIGGSLQSGGETAVAELSMPGAETIQGQVTSTGTYTVRLDWRDGDGNVVRAEKFAENVSANSWTDLDGVVPKSPYVDVVVVDTSGSGQTVDATVNMV